MIINVGIPDEFRIQSILSYFGVTHTTFLTKQDIDIVCRRDRPTDLKINIVETNDGKTYAVVEVGLCECNSDLKMYLLRDHTETYLEILSDYIGDRFEMEYADEPYGIAIRQHFFKKHPFMSASTFYLWLFAEFKDNFDRVLEILPMEFDDNSLGIKLVNKIKNRVEMTNH